MNISEIYVHDVQLHRVIEDIKADTVTMEVELPILEHGEHLENRLLVFDDAYNYQVFEQPWHGIVTILDMNVVRRRVVVVGCVSKPTPDIESYFAPESENLSTTMQPERRWWSTTCKCFSFFRDLRH